MNTEDEFERTVQATETTFTILETLAEANGMRLTELADELDVPKSTLYRYLRTLLQCEYLIRRGDTYHVSLRFTGLSRQARTRREGYKMAKQKVQELAEETDERAQFMVEEHGKAVYAFRATGTHAVRTDPGVGNRVALHTISAGKAIMAEWSRDRLRTYLDDQGLSAATSNTITSEEEFFEEIETVRDRGYAVNRQENIEGLRAVGVSVCDPDDEVVGGLSVSGPISRMKGDWFETELPDMLMGFAKEIELNLQYS